MGFNCLASSDEMVFGVLNLCLNVLVGSANTCKGERVGRVGGLVCDHFLF